MTAESETVRVSLTKAQGLAAGAVLRGYLAHQRERLGNQAEENPNFRNVQAALSAIEEQVGPPPNPAEEGQRPASSR